MRTTLDIDCRVIAAARARVDAGTSRTLGEAASDLALAGLEHDRSTRRPTRGGLVLLTSPPGHLITDDLVAEALLDE